MSRCSCPDLECACCFQESTSVEILSGDGEPGNCVQFGVKVASDEPGAENVASLCADGVSVQIANSGNVVLTDLTGGGACPIYELNSTANNAPVTAGCGISVSAANEVAVQVNEFALCDGNLYCESGFLKAPPPGINHNFEQPLGPTNTAGTGTLGAIPPGTQSIITDYGTVAIVTNQSFCKGSTVYLSGGGRQRLWHNTTTATSNNAAFQYIGINGGAPQEHRYEAWAVVGGFQSSAWSMGPRSRTGNVAAGGNVTIQEQNRFSIEQALSTQIAYWNPGGWALHIDSSNNLG